MNGKNKVILIGNLGKDPETRTGDFGTMVKFSLATTKSFTSHGEKKEETQWHSVVIFGTLAEIAGKYLKKGSRIYLEGEIKYRQHDEKWYTDIIGNDFMMLDSKKEEGEQNPAPKSTPKPAPKSTPKPAEELPEAGDDLPF